MKPAKRRHGIGARAPRREDARHLAGRGTFIADLRLAGLREVAFVRSQVPHGRLARVAKPADAEPGTVWTAEDLAPFAQALTATSTLPGFRAAPLPNLASDKVRYVGEAIALAIGDTRAEAEDLAGEITADIEALPPIPDFTTALAGETLVHDEWPDNIFATTQGDFGDLDEAVRAAAVSITREYTMNRQAVVPLETRGVAAHYDRSADLLTVWSSTQTPHMIRDMIALQLGIEARRVRVVSPDMGGGFGAKCSVYPEEVALAAIAMQLDYPVRWVEDRWEAMVSSTQARDHHYRITAHAAADGTLLGVEADIVVDSGAYSVHPWTATMDATMSSAMIPGPYRLRNYRFRTRSVASNKTPSGPYRGVARPGACFAIERTLDDLAHALDIEPHEMRMHNMVTPAEMPYRSVANKVYDSGDYAEAVRRAAALLGHGEWRARQQATPLDSRHRIGIGYGSFTEQTAHGCIEWASRGLAITIGTEGARLAMDATGSFTLAAGIKSHGQSSETTLAQVVSEVFDVDIERVSVLHGDTAVTPRGDGTFASRSMVMAGGATFGAARELAAKVLDIAAVLLGESAASLTLRDGAVHSRTGSIDYAALAKEFLFTPDHVPGVAPGLECTCYYQPEVQTGAFTYATHAVAVEVDLDTGDVKLLDYAIVEDCGTIVNPQVVDGQLIGGIAQGIGTALLEELVYDADGQPKSTSFLDYLLPGASEVPEIKIGHLETPSPYTVFGMKGAGEGGSIAPPAAIANAVTDALREFGALANETPISPARVWSALQLANAQAREVGAAR
ncbi:xanthine dehydrogenase family protein [Amycolatopsis rubida]|uniref:Xanthine dehydrogenase family protein n=1 Tax=Amycolatopsis rubida TaxID=112413 RepID=A0ABX0BWC8_9PSEU|nr:xanthine dehydrogenase family protein molybdopterin-binding subunit [Amycolatopsis sp. M39]MYW92114.1 molybdopterin-dependent oxidoreductase [Amycolatopsis rubida]NEC57100.1 xanthine dehydrogenase family protein [Amycolatopsis rubida]OAP27720.1 Caffeine dehydrogenase subunit alpha [Amycolatopsis sp. M39]